MSLASTLVMSAKVRRFSLKVLASACEAALRVCSLASCSRLRVGSIASDFVPTLNRRLRDGLVEQPVPGRIGRHRFLVKQLLDPILELIGLFLADVFEPGTIASERRIAHGSFEPGIIEPIELENEEQKMDRSGGDALLHVGVELGAIGIDGIAGVDQPGIRDQPPEQIVERLVALYRAGERAPGFRSVRKRRKLAFVVLLEGGTFRIGAVEIPRHLRIVHSEIKIGQVPFRQDAESSGGAIGGADRAAFSRHELS